MGWEGVLLRLGRENRDDDEPKSSLNSPRFIHTHTHIQAWPGGGECNRRRWLAAAAEIRPGSIFACFSCAFHEVATSA